MPERVVKLLRIRVSTPIWLYVIIFGLIFAGAWKIEGLVKENTKRIADIQDSRVTSCKQNYTGIYEALQLFLPPIEKRTAQDIATDKKVKKFVKTKQAGCVTQTASKGEK